MCIHVEYLCHVFEYSIFLDGREGLVGMVRRGGSDMSSLQVAIATRLGIHNFSYIALMILWWREVGSRVFCHAIYDCITNFFFEDYDHCRKVYDYLSVHHFWSAFSFSLIEFCRLHWFCLSVNSLRISITVLQVSSKLIF